ncbi:hypothetical protein BK816_04320 [Boudabousia tangfeifanii]|uniref:Uncharacterized protein n=1 Tax=Boudabousia tangfeifanii TaxID=1912795 RepID=A0A1D9MK09_9ACTO|nr:hypothetical protein [Boudabousia tangfeifanii]AOZ72616.1 hypothetical protein BK816_04320 [Boudabousia tangfeifanii]
MEHKADKPNLPIIVAMNGAWPNAQTKLWKEALVTYLGQPLVDLTDPQSEFFLAEDDFRGMASSAELIEKWQQTLASTINLPALLILPPAMVELKNSQELLADCTRPIFLLSVPARTAWQYLGLGIAGQPVGLGAIRAQWMNMWSQRVSAWENVGAKVIDCSQTEPSSLPPKLFP